MSDLFFPRLKTEEAFEGWLEQSKANKAWWFEQLSESERNKLDMSVESMDWLGRWLCERYPDLDSARNEKDIQLLDGVARYVAESFMKHFGGELSINLRSKGLVYWAYPHIINYKSKPELMVPLQFQVWVTATIGRPEPDRLANIFKKTAERIRNRYGEDSLTP